jgi:hypothetical protein
MFQEDQLVAAMDMKVTFTHKDKIQTAIKTLDGFYT